MSSRTRRLLDKSPGSPTLLGERTHFIGNLAAAGPFVLFGHIQGDGRIDGPLNVMLNAHWEGDVHAASAIVAGKVTGNITVDEKLEIGRMAVIRGSVTAKTLAIARGAVVDGNITVTGNAPIIEFEEKRKENL